jgi:hypothetical protein
MDARLPGNLAALRRWARMSRILLVGYMLICIAWIGSAGTVFWIAGTAPIQPQDTLTIVLLAVVGFASIGWMLVALLSALVVSLWIYRAHANLRTIGLDELHYSPGWAVGSFFVPLANLMVPFRAMRELYNRSFGEEAHFASTSVGDVTSWWSSFLVGALIQAFLVMIALIDALTPIFFTTPPIANGLLALFAVLLLGGSAFFLFRIIGAVTAAQNSVTGVGETFA